LAGDHERRASAPVSFSHLRVLIVYYTKTGNTESVANAIRAVLEPNHEVVMQKIEMENEYSNHLPHLNPRILFDTLLNRKPRIKPAIDINPFDLVCVGTPNWFGRVAPSINTFIDNVTLVDGMKAIAFVSSGLGKQSYADGLKERLEKKGFKVLRGLSFTLRETSESQMKEIREAIT
jgi:flavodoxin